MSAEKARIPFFRAGEEILDTGVYRIFHADHRISHEAALCAGHQFPRCAQCGDDVHFELLQRAPELERDPDFHRLSLYEIPHPADEQPEVPAKKAS